MLWTMGGTGMSTKEKGKWLQANTRTDLAPLQEMKAGQLSDAIHTPNPHCAHRGGGAGGGRRTMFSLKGSKAEPMNC